MTKPPYKKNLKELMAEGTLAMPGAFNAITARLIEEAGFPGVYVSGAGLANAGAALPDIGLLSMTEVVAQAAYIINSVRVPCLVDIDTGFGGAVNVARTVSELQLAGAGGVQIEDQKMPKRCGHLSGKSLVATDVMCEKIAAAVEARDVNGDGFLIVARTDAKAVEGAAKAIERAGRYIEAGADCIFPEALETKEEFALFNKEINAPLLANMTEFGKTPCISMAEFEQMGYGIVIFPLTIMRVLLKATKDILQELKQTGTQEGLLERMMTRKELYDLLDYDYYEGVGEKSVKGARPEPEEDDA